MNDNFLLYLYELFHTYFIVKAILEPVVLNANENSKTYYIGSFNRMVEAKEVNQDIKIPKDKDLKATD